MTQKEANIIVDRFEVFNWIDSFCGLTSEDLMIWADQEFNFRASASCSKRFPWHQDSDPLCPSRPLHWASFHLKRDNLLAARTTRECVISNQSSSKADLGKSWKAHWDCSEVSSTNLRAGSANQTVAQLIICSITSPSSAANNEF